MDIAAIVTQYIIPSLLGGGLAVTIIGLWMKWEIKKRHMRIKEHQKSVDTWRANLLPLLTENQLSKV